MPDALHLFLTDAGWSDASKRPVAGDLSARQYTRLSFEGKTAILMQCDPSTDASLPAYLEMTKWLRAQRLSVPEVYKVDLSRGFALLEDFADNKLTALIRDNPGKQQIYYESILDALVSIRNAPLLSLPQPSARDFCEATKLTDGWYPNANTNHLDAFRFGLETVLAQVLKSKPTVSLRDFHADNIMWLPDRPALQRPGLLDFQDAIITHPAYDLMSLLTDARTDVAADLRANVIATYADLTGDNIETLSTAFAALGAQRNLRILGIFAQAARRFGKTQHLPALPRVYGCLMECVQHPALAPFSKSLVAALQPPDADLIAGLTA